MVRCHVCKGYGHKAVNCKFLIFTWFESFMLSTLRYTFMHHTIRVTTNSVPYYHHRQLCLAIWSSPTTYLPFCIHYFAPTRTYLPDVFHSAYNFYIIPRRIFDFAHNTLCLHTSKTFSSAEVTSVLVSLVASTDFLSGQNVSPVLQIQL